MRISNYNSDKDKAARNRNRKRKCFTINFYNRNFYQRIVEE